MITWLLARRDPPAQRLHISSMQDPVDYPAQGVDCHRKAITACSRRLAGSLEYTSRGTARVNVSFRADAVGLERLIQILRWRRRGERMAWVTAPCDAATYTLMCRNARRAQRSDFTAVCRRNPRVKRIERFAETSSLAMDYPAAECRYAGLPLLTLANSSSAKSMAYLRAGRHSDGSSRLSPLCG